MCSSVDGVYLALIGDGALGPALAERHGSWSNSNGNSGTRRQKVCGVEGQRVSSKQSFPVVRMMSLGLVLSLRIVSLLWYHVGHIFRSGYSR